MPPAIKEPIHMLSRVGSPICPCAAPIWALTAEARPPNYNGRTSSRSS